MEDASRLVHSRSIKSANTERQMGVMEEHCPEQAKKIGHTKPYSAGPIRIKKLSARKDKKDVNTRCED